MVTTIGGGIIGLNVCQQQLKTDPLDQFKSDPLFNCGFH